MVKSVLIPYQNKGIVGNLHVNNKSSKLIIICHGFGDSKDEPGIVRVTELLSNFFNVFRFTFTDYKDPYLPEEKLNIDTVVEYFSKKYKEIVLLGVSLGGLSATIGTTNNKYVNTLVLVNPFAYFHNKVAWRFRKIIIGMFLTYPFIKKVRNNLNFYFRSFKPNLITIPTLVIIAKNDQKVDAMHGKKMFKKLNSSKKKLIIDEKIDHGLTKDIYKQTVTEYISNWLTK